MKGNRAGKGIIKESTNPKKITHIEWDQQKLNQDKKYIGTYQKINQPKTPYRQPQQGQDIESAMEIEQQPEDIQVKEHLQKAVANRSKNSGNKPNLEALNQALKKQIEVNGWKQCYQEQIVDEQSERKKQKFHDMRNKHYAHQYNKIKNIEDDD